MFGYLWLSWILYPVTNALWVIKMVNSYFNSYVWLYMNRYLWGAYGPRMGCIFAIIENSTCISTPSFHNPKISVWVDKTVEKYVPVDMNKQVKGSGLFLVIITTGALYWHITTFQPHWPMPVMGMTGQIFRSQKGWLLFRMDDDHHASYALQLNARPIKNLKNSR